MILRTKYIKDLRSLLQAQDIPGFFRLLFEYINKFHRKTAEDEKKFRLMVLYLYVALQNHNFPSVFMLTKFLSQFYLKLSIKANFTKKSKYGLIGG